MKIVAANGADIPAVGFGTYGMSRDEMLLIIPAALDAGFRHIDTAQIYRNEAEVGECAAASGVARTELSWRRKCGCRTMDARRSRLPWTRAYDASAPTISICSRSIGQAAATCSLPIRSETSTR
jgi:aryl-alcohol dehydrogenase-like predicted oxidoreductase